MVSLGPALQAERVAVVSTWRGYPCPDTACRAHNPEANPALCASCEARLAKLSYVSHTGPGMDLVALQLLDAMRRKQMSLTDGID